MSGGRISYGVVVVYAKKERNTIMLPTIDMVNTGKNIQRLRKQCGLTVKDLQDQFGFATPQAIYKWQHGTAMPTVDNLLALAMIFGVKMDDIIVAQSAYPAKMSA